MNWDAMEFFYFFFSLVHIAVIAGWISTFKLPLKGPFLWSHFQLILIIYKNKLKPIINQNLLIKLTWDHLKVPLIIVNP